MNVNICVTVHFVYSLHSNSQLDISVKGGMIRDLFNLAGFLIPEKNDVLANPGPPPDLRYHTCTHRTHCTYTHNTLNANMHTHMHAPYMHAYTDTHRRLATLPDMPRLRK